MPAKIPEYNSLMTKRIRNILLVCNNYDSFTLEEDGHIEARIAREFAELNLNNPPSLTRVASTAEALELLQNSGRFDLIITMYTVGGISVFEFSHRAKKLCPDTPIVLLSAYSKEIYRQIAQGDASDIDDFFCWNNSPELIIAIVKLLEDKLNAEHDIGEMGVQAILLVEDSVRYYSTYLPMLYKIVLQQNNASIQEALNLQQQTLRKRARPKILMAKNYDEAISLYERYKDNLLGVISDIGFVMHKGDKPSDERLDAGIELCCKIREITPKMPILLQSSQESMRQTAQELRMGFVMKRSSMLEQEIIDYIGREFAFGDFVLTNDTGDEIARVHNLFELDKMIKTLPDEALMNLAATNYMSKWLKARGLFQLSETFASMSVEQDGTIQAHRTALTNTVHDFRISQAIGVVAQYDPATFNDAIGLSKVGNGYMGGKARGLCFINRLIVNHNLLKKWDDVRVLIPRTMLITTEYFDEFIQSNGLQYVIDSDLPDEEILAEFVSAPLPDELRDALLHFIRVAHKPLAIRSSSVLEDSYYQPFAGVYSTYMIPDTEDENQKLRLLCKAVKSVYASVYFASARSYIQATGHVLSEEKMGVVVQEVCGSQDGTYYFPTLSGVARSVNFYPIGHESADGGIAKVAMGLGKAVVDGDMVLRFSPEYPKHVLQTSTPEQTMTETQQAIFALDLRPDQFRTSVNDSVNLARIPVNECENFRNMKFVASTFDLENQRIVDSAYPQGPKYITFAQILKYNTFPLAEIVKELLHIAEEEMKSYIEIEFAANLDRETPVFNVLQIRPISVDSRNSIVDWAKLDESDALIKSSCALGTGWISGIKDIVYIPRGRFDVMKTQEMAREITKLNQKLASADRQYILVGYGRWGSSISTLGIPVQWGDISDAKVLVEASLEDFRVEPSQGTHFFQNLTSFNAGYINVDTFGNSDDICDIDALDKLPAVEEGEFFRHVSFENELTVCIDGRNNRAIIKL